MSTYAFANKHLKISGWDITSIYFGLGGRIDRFVCSHVELGIKHVLDQTAELHKAVGLQVVQWDVVQGWDLFELTKTTHKTKNEHSI